MILERIVWELRDVCIQTTTDAYFVVGKGWKFGDSNEGLAMRTHMDDRSDLLHQDVIGKRRMEVEVEHLKSKIVCPLDLELESRMVLSVSKATTRRYW